MPPTGCNTVPVAAGRSGRSLPALPLARRGCTCRLSFLELFQSNPCCTTESDPHLKPRRWSSSSWFAGGVLQDAPAAPAAQPVASQPAVPGDARQAQQQDGAGLLLVGGARAQSRFSGRTAIPIATCTPLSSAGNAAVQAPAAAAATAAAAPTAAAPHPSMRSGQEQPQAAPLPALGRHAAWAGRPAGHTIDGSTPTRSSSACGEHTSRWVFDTASWQWRVRDGQPCAAAASPSDKHQLAARRWGDSRDGLGAAALGRQQAEQQAASKANDSSSAAAATARPAAPAKRQRLHVGAMTGDTSDAGWAAVGGLHRQKEALMEAVAWPLAHPRLFARLGAGGARGVLLHGPPGGWMVLTERRQEGVVASQEQECTVLVVCGWVISTFGSPVGPACTALHAKQEAARRTWCVRWQPRRGWASWCSTAASVRGRTRRSG